jgi:hypothetical protein
MTDSVVEALESQLLCYRRLAKLAELQHEHVRHNQTESLLDVLKSRQAVLEEIANFERALAPAKRNWAEYLGKLEISLRKKAETLLAETRKLLEQITTSDQNDALVLQQRKLNLGKQINKVSAAKQINRTYAAAAYGTRQSRMDLQR